MQPGHSTTAAPTPRSPQLDLALSRWREALGAEHVLTDPADLDEFADPYTPASFGFRTTTAVLRPGSVEEVQALVRIASETSVPIWTTSQGRNNGYGGSAPREPDAVVVNLRRMNRVLEINEELAYVVVEPGVSFAELYDAVQASGAKLWVDIPDLSWGSVIGNTLEYGGGYTRNYDHASSQCGMEVVLADGTLVRTGMGAMTGNHAWHLARHGYGPTTDSLFFQSNMGIVTKMGYWAMPRPDAYMDCWIRVRDDADLEALIDTFRPFMLDGTVGNCPTVFTPLTVLPMAVKRSDVWQQDGLVPRELAEKIGWEAQRIGAWNVRFALYGDDAVVARNFERMRDAFAEIPRAEITGESIDPAEAVLDSPALRDQKARVHAGVPDLSMLKLLEWPGGEAGGHLFFASTVPLTGAHARTIVELTRSMQEAAGFDYHAAFALYPRHAIHISLLLYDVADEERVRRIHELYRALVAAAAERGYGEYRAHTALMDLVADTYDFNDRSHMAMVERIKDALDPAGILSPGKQGIWPGRMRPRG